MPVALASADEHGQDARGTRCDEHGQDARATFLTRASRVAAVAWLVLILIGLSISWDRRRRLWPTYAVFAAVAAAHVLLADVPWVRTALEPMTLVWASLAVAPLLVRLALTAEDQDSPPRAAGQRPLRPEHALEGPHYEIPGAVGRGEETWSTR